MKKLKKNLMGLALVAAPWCLFADTGTTPPVVAPAAATQPAAGEKLNAGAPNGGGTYDSKTMWGMPVLNAQQKLDHVAENPLQTHERKNCVFVVVSGYKDTAAKAGLSGRLRLAVWDREDIYGKEGIKPYRASSHSVKDAPEKMRFKICGLAERSYSFFAHYDEQSLGKVRRNWLGIPQDLYGFTNAENKNELLKRVGLGAPPFARTLYPVLAKDEEINMVLK